jgi:hypothetical protein
MHPEHPLGLFVRGTLAYCRPSLTLLALAAALRAYAYPVSVWHIEKGHLRQRYAPYEAGAQASASWWGFTSSTSVVAFAYVEIRGRSP